MASVIEKEVITTPETEVPNIPVMDEVDQVLLNAERYMQEYGWTSGLLRDSIGQVCLGGAISYCPFEGPSQKRSEALKRLEVTLQRYTNGKLRNFAYWNDKICQTKEEAMAMLRRARERK